MSEEELKEMLENHKNFKLIKFNEDCLKVIKSAVKDYISRVRSYGMAEIFTKVKLEEVRHLLECNYLMNTLNMNTTYSISRMIQFKDSEIYYAEMVSGSPNIIQFVSGGGGDVVKIGSLQIMDSLNVLTFPYKFLLSLAKKDRLAAQHYLFGLTDKNQKNIPRIQTRDSISDFKKHLKEAISELRKTPPGKVDLSKVVRKMNEKIPINAKRIALTTFKENLPINGVEYDGRNKKFIDLDSGEEF